MTWYHLVVFLHVFSATLWVGGIFFLSLVAVPVTRGFDPATRARVVSEFGRRFRKVGWFLLLVLWVTGIFQAGARGATVENVLNGDFFATRFGFLLGAKLALVMMMMLVSYVHDFKVGPETARAAEAGEDIGGLRATASLLARTVALLVIGIVLLAVLLVR